MSIITSFTVVQIIALLITIILAVLVLSHGKARYKIALLFFLAISSFWSFTSLMANMALPFEQAVLWGKCVPVFALGTTIAYAYLVAVFTSYPKDARIIAWGGAAFMILLLALVIPGYIPREFILLDNGIVSKEYGGWYYFMAFGGFVFLGKAIHLLWKKRGSTTSAEERNRVAYLFLGVSFIITCGIVFKTVSVQNFAVDHIGHLINAIVLSYALVRHHLVDIKLVIRKAVVLSGVSFFLFDSFLILFFVMNPLLESYLSSWQQLAAILVVALALALLFNPLRTTLEEYTYRILYGKRYDYRQMVLNFADRMSHIIELPELAEAMLKPITRAVNSSQASLLFNADGYYQTYFAERCNPEEPKVSISFREDGPIVNWLKQNNTPLYRETITNLIEFKDLWQEERNFLDAAQIELLCPIKSKHELVAILALSQKSTNGIYLQDDIDLIITMAHEAAVVIENAQLYARAKERANTDELTGLFNHRYFHERLDEEISRCSRFGNIFSLIILDIDMFKEHNDIHGHLSGDEVLAYTGRLIQQALRRVDIGFRYGGDEFSILLPETPLKGAKRLAERLRKELETATNLQGTPLTCSLGIGTWPTDGVMREDIIQAVDAALYLAKRTGRNRLCLASEVELSDILTSRPGKQSKKAALSTIYALAATVDAKDTYTYGHSKKISKYVAYIAEAMGYSPEDIEQIRVTALLHDIGKIGIADHILNKSGYLTPEDFEPIKAHPDKGVAILKHVDDLKGCLPGVQYHHEHYDGTGYPSGLKGDSIPLDARILAVADAYDAMTSKRPYRLWQASQEEAIKELESCAGTQFDPEIVRVFVNILRNELQETKPLEKVSQ